MGLDGFRAAESPPLQNVRSTTGTGRKCFRKAPDNRCSPGQATSVGRTRQAGPRLCLFEVGSGRCDRSRGWMIARVGLKLDQRGHGFVWLRQPAASLADRAFACKRAEPSPRSRQVQGLGRDGRVLSDQGLGSRFAMAGRPQAIEGWALIVPQAIPSDGSEIRQTAHRALSASGLLLPLPPLLITTLGGGICGNSMALAQASNEQAPRVVMRTPRRTQVFNHGTLFAAVQIRLT